MPAPELPADPADSADPADPADPDRTGAPQRRSAVSRSSTERIMSQATALGSLLFAVQTIIAVSTMSAYVSVPWLIAVPTVMFLLLFLVVAAALLRRNVHEVMGLFAIVMLVALAVWPLGVGDLSAVGSRQPWLYNMIDVGMAFAALAFPVRWAAAYLVVTSAVYVVIRSTPSGGGVELGLAVLDSIYVLIVGAFILMITTTLRVASDRVDAAQFTAMRQYAQVARNHAAEVERAKIDALVHDTVLTTLLTAARAESSDERAVSVRMADTALETLQQAPDAFDQTHDVTLRAFTDRLVDAAHLLSPRIAISTEQFDDRRLPGAVAEAIFSATLQAMINSLQHAGDSDPAGDGSGVQRTLSIHTTCPTELTVQVSDTGVGFDPDAVPAARLGLRVSIRERVESVGGGVTILSMPGGGASIVVSWAEPTEPGAYAEASGHALSTIRGKK